MLHFRCVKQSKCYVQVCNSNNEVDIEKGDGGEILSEIFETRTDDLESLIFADTRFANVFEFKT